MRIIGCLYYASTLPKQDKFSPRAIKFVLLGYGIFQKGYKIYDLEKQVVFISRDVVFNEFIFPFKTIQDNVELLFPEVVDPDNLPIITLLMFLFCPLLTLQLHLPLLSLKLLRRVLILFLI